MSDVRIEMIEKAKNDVMDVLKKRHSHLTPLEILSMFSHITGQVLALQDQRKITPQMGMEVIAKNIEAGNESVVDGIMKSEGSA